MPASLATSTCLILYFANAYNICVRMSLYSGSFSAIFIKNYNYSHFMFQNLILHFQELVKTQ